MRPRAKYAVIYRHRDEYPVSVMCRFFEVSRSGYYDFVHRLGRPEKKYDLLSEIRRRRKWQQMGQQVHKYENLLNRKFHAEAPKRRPLRSCGSTATRVVSTPHKHTST